MENLVFIWQGYVSKLKEQILTAKAAGCLIVFYSNTENGTVFSDTDGNPMTTTLLLKSFEKQKNEIRMFLKKDMWDMQGFLATVFQYDDNGRYFSKDGTYIGEKQSAIMAILHRTDNWAVQDSIRDKERKYGQYTLPY